VNEDALKRCADEYLGECRAKRTTPQVNELAVKVRLTVSKLSNYFLSVVGMRPSTYLKREHVLYTIQVIARTDLDYATIARITGFGSRTTLFRSIRRVTGKTPDHFRKNKAGKRSRAKTRNRGK
jgi:transcriptional regulator GlxA family with amidase domain